MKKEYDLSKMKFRRNPYAKLLKKQITIRLGVDVLDYFKALAEGLRARHWTRTWSGCLALRTA